MKTPIKIRNNFPYKKELEGFITQIITFISIEAVYLSKKHNEEEEQQYWVVVLTAQDIQHIPPQLLSYANTFSTVHVHLNIRVYGISYATIECKKGCSFFMQQLFFGQCIYGEPPQWLAYFKISKFPAIIQKSKDHIDYELEKIQAFHSAASMHKKQGAFEVAAFNYHQSIELFFRVAEWLLIGKCKITHRILDHIAYLQAFEGCFNDILTLDNPENKVIFEKLDSAYSNARYSNEFSVSENELEQFHQKATQLITLAKERFELELDIVQSLYNKRQLQTKKKENKPLKGTLYTEDTHLIKAIEFLKTKYDLQDAYLLHKQSQSTIQKRYLTFLEGSKSLFNTYTVVLFTPKKIKLPPQRLTDTLYKKSNQGCKIYCICYTVGEAVTAMDEGDNFLCHIRDRAKQVYSHNFSLQELNQKAVYYKPLWEAMYSNWSIRYRRARYLCSIFTYEQYLAEPSAQLSILYTAFCQIYLGLLFVFWEYTPKRYSLEYLIGLCNGITSIPYNGFDFSTMLPPSWYESLLELPNHLKTAKQTTLNKEEIDQVAKVCNACIDHCRQLAESELERSKPIYYRVAH
ncbi:MAG: hypothetical protein CMC13_15805 [Flavobacteriaceae bacterium]|nr:hypothetical protein [Flavobacteriaceae bacterium]